MSFEEIQFYLRHRKQVTAWAALQKRVDQLMRDAVSQDSPETAIKLMNGDVGDAELDFYIRNRRLITVWDDLQIAAGLLLHDWLFEEVRKAGGDAALGKRGWTIASLPHTKFVELPPDELQPSVDLIWTRGDLLSTRRGYASPRLVLSLHPDRWKDDERTRIVTATRAAARELGMKQRGKEWWPYWGVLPEIGDAQDLRAFAVQCTEKLYEASASLYPLVRDAILATDRTAADT